MENNLFRSSDDKVIAGVCGGIAHRFDLNATGIRWAMAIATLILGWTGLPVIAYLVLWIVLKERPTKNVVNV